MGKVISLTFSVLQLILFVAFIIIVYELIRWAVVSFFKKRFMRSVTAFLRRNEVRFDQYKLTNKLIIRDQLLHDQEVARKILEESHKREVPYEEVRDEAESYIDEIVPTFNLLSYYKFGYTIARLLLKSLYEVVIDEAGKDKVQEIPEDSLVIYVMNHRSNLDYIVVAYMLMENISVSYAVGEWARVFPLDIIFKSFGAYFVRRNFRNPLYHTILKKYVQLISRNNVTQGIFLEGRLSRDGKFLPPKTGLLDYILTMAAENEEQRNITFVPVGINYDWILEDKTLVSEWKHGKRSMTFTDYVVSFFSILLRLPYLLVVNTYRILSGRIREHGYISVQFGDPIPLESLLQIEDLPTDDGRQDRRDRLKATGTRLLSKISEVVPVTPVSLLALTLLESPATEIRKEVCLDQMRELLEQLEENGANLLLGSEYESHIQNRRRLESEKWFRNQEMVEFERDLLKGDEVQKTLQIAAELLRRRKIIRVTRNQLEIIPEKQELLEYYANTIRHYLEKYKETALTGSQD